MDAMYSAVFSGNPRPSPAKFLYSWWQHASHLASYEQQDAHDFFITMLDQFMKMSTVVKGVDFGQIPKVLFEVQITNAPIPYVALDTLKEDKTVKQTFASYPSDDFEYA
ncbi:hypothetical protein HPP92_021726 [Vanilla planifolia]|uniref:Uncharacterized protein n=1 Tax=Vanilla planifolia TaxID=51239 RepID=A0A835Q1P8_VANPL|nr:hypothetical protein HPP92_021726 [Vanilla planifolia]